MNKKPVYDVEWKQERLAKHSLAKRLSELNLHPGYFQIIDDGINENFAELVYLLLPEETK